MRRALLAAILLVTALPMGAASSSAAAVISQQVKTRNVVSQPVSIRLENEGDSAIELANPWVIRDVRSGEELSHYWFSDEQLTLDPGEAVVWEWLQDDACYGACQNVRAGEPVGPGAYQVEVTRADGMFTYNRAFRVGQYFTIGFESRPRAKFIVYVTTPEEVAQMEAEAAAEDKTLIVSGKVRWHKRYNPDWNFTMGPASIVLGEVFIEVCDASPYYVQRHRKEWLGKRWCPWSSYVEKVGR